MKKLGIIILILLVSSVGCVALGLVPPVILVFEVGPPTITSGQSATLNWNTTGATSVSIDNNIGNVPVAGTRQVSPDSSTAYTITATNRWGTVTRSVILTINEPVSAILSVDPTVITTGATATLQWNVSGATTAVIDQGIGNVPAAGSRVVSPTTTTIYTLNANNSTSSVSKSVTVTVNPPVVATFSVSPESVNRGRSSQLRWNVTGATKITIEPGIGDVAARGTKIVSPNRTTTYTLTATSSCCAVTKTAVLTVSSLFPEEERPIIALLNISPSTIEEGESAILQWSVFGASSVFINQGIGYVPFSGSIFVSPSSNAAYTITAVNDYGATSRTVGVLVVEP